MTTSVPELIAAIQLAFAGRAMPVQVVSPGPRGCDLREDAAHFVGVDRYAISAEFLEQYSSGLSALTGDAFRHLLPGVMCTSIREARRDLMAVDLIIGALDRSNMPDSWDDGFVERYCALTPEECLACQQWILWLGEDASSIGDAFWHSQLTRAFETIELIRGGANVNVGAS